MWRMTMAALTVSTLALALAGCGPHVDPAQQKIFDTCMAGAAWEFSDSVRPGPKVVEREQAEAIGNYKENCMNNFGFKYDETKSGCRRPPSWDPDYPQRQSDVTCYSSATSR
jgi:hypothetical protein